MLYYTLYIDVSNQYYLDSKLYQLPKCKWLRGWFSSIDNFPYDIAPLQVKIKP